MLQSHITTNDEEEDDSYGKAETKYDQKTAADSVRQGFGGGGAGGSFLAHQQNNAYYTSQLDYSSASAAAALAGTIPVTTSG